METGERDMFEDDQKPAALPQHELPEDSDHERQELGIPMEDSLSRAPSFSESSQRLLSYLSNTSISALSTSSSSLHLLPQEPPMKRMKLETLIQSSNDLLAAAGLRQSSSDLFAAASISNERAARQAPPPLARALAKEGAADADGSERVGAITPPKPDDKREKKSADESGSSDPSQKGVVSPERSATMATYASLRTASLQASGKLAVPAPPSSPTPLKATTMSHLQKKYSEELEYMLREFQKLERQLLGAKGPSEESAGSRERREKLHSFIQHLEDTVRQIESGCQLELQGISTLAAGLDSKGLADSSVALSRLTREKEEEESIQKLEEHILTNLLPVKVRLTKQLAAQQGAKHNPVGMPHVHGGSTVSSDTQGKGTFAGCADQWRKQEEEAKSLTEQHIAPVEQDQTQFGKPLAGGSFLTQKLHGQTLGSATRKQGAGVGTGSNRPDRPKMYFAGMAGSAGQIHSSVSAANSVHNLVIKNRAVLEIQRKKPEDEEGMPTTQALEQPDQVASNAMKESLDLDLGMTMTHAERHVLHRKRKKKKRLRQEARLQEMQRQKRSALETQIEPVGQGSKPRKKMVAKGKKGGPRPVEYMCALCNECYSSKCDDNPWWALAQHECAKCCKMQIPRIDIGAPANAIEYHPALLAHAEDNSSGGGANGVGSAAQILASQMKAPSVVVTTTAPTTTVKYDGDLDSLGSDISNDESDRLYLSDDDSLYSAEFDPEAVASMSPSEQAENERFGMEYGGPTLADGEASRLLILMAHASSCPGQHKSAKHGEVCRSTKWMMLHVRDCPGTTSSYDVCPFAWCRKVKHLLFHLVSCTKPQCCTICAPAEIDSNWNTLSKLNDHRLKKFREGLTAQWKTRATAFRSKSLGSQREIPASSMHVGADPVSNTAPLSRSPYRNAASRSSEINIGTTPFEGLDSTTLSLVGKISVSSTTSEKSAAAVNIKQESQNEEIESDTAAGFGKERSIIDKALFKEEIDEEGSDFLNKWSGSEKSAGDKESELVKDLGTAKSIGKPREANTVQKEATSLESAGGTEGKDTVKVVPNSCSNILHTEKAAAEAVPNGCSNPLQTPTNAV